MCVKLSMVDLIDNLTSYLYSCLTVLSLIVTQIIFQIWLKKQYTFLLSFIVSYKVFIRKQIWENYCSAVLRQQRVKQPCYQYVSLKLKRFETNVYYEYS